ncbi:tetratricopeptide repeat protein [Chryseobacterium indoltheticum]|uniref:tetratricopeptide repeat protein n=1 Tax=Chryseobacterium indoltheticum TaxID=254 RepID=UPI003F496F05
MKGLMLQEKAYFELDRKNYNASIICIRSSQKLLNWTKKDHDFYSVNNEQLLGLNYYYLEQYHKALNHYKSGLLQSKSFPETYLTGLIHNGIANIYVNLHKIEEAEEELSKAKRIAEETQYLQLKEEIYETAQKIYMSQK